MAYKKRNCYPRQMRYVNVEIKGKDGVTHAITTEASGLYDAARQGLESWSKFWWYDPDVVIVVQSGDERWAVRQEKVRGK
jgi:hypothetical protein